MPTAPATCVRCAASYEAVMRVSKLTGRVLGPESVYCAPCTDALAREAAAAEAERIAAAAAARREKCLAELDVPPEFNWATLETIRPDWGSEAQRARVARALQVARQIVLEHRHGMNALPFVVFHGRPGNGKSLLTWAIAKAFASDGRSARVVRLADMVRDLRENWGGQRSGPSDKARLHRYRSPEFLGIDEVSKHAFFGKPHQHLLDVVNHRIDHHRPTVITSNDHMDQLEDLLGAPLMSRLALGGRLHFGDAEDHRQLVGRRSA